MSAENAMFEQYINFLKWSVLGKIQQCISQFKSQGSNPKLYFEFTIMALKKGGLLLIPEAENKLKSYIYDPLIEGKYEPTLSDISVSDKRILYQCIHSQDDFKSVIESESKAFSDPKNKNTISCEVKIRPEFGGVEVEESIKRVIMLFSHYSSLNL